MTPEPPKVVRLDELEAIPGPGSLTWHPVRLALGVRAFGCNAYTAGKAGQDVVEPHTEDPKLAHQELYFVSAGRARFVIDGEMHDAPAGTYVFIPDPASHRHAVAEEAGTTVLSFGGPPTFEPSAWEWAFLAGPLIRTDPARAREILRDGLEQHPGAATLHYNLACVNAVEGRRDEALGALAEAVRARPQIAEWAREDEDLESLRDDPAFRKLVAPDG
ncbi:MAG: AraC family ligand binding domain-containing protein [Solirubrobacterales bacterium]|nr:AraC family ligand binding domain-containing protein [Solirubrobacterales bacterium]